MANDIARQFAHLDPADAGAAVAAHMERFWDARMRAQLREAVDAGDERVDP
ncbi:MAG: formate dehydrogenase subunit delta, partial [Acidimicrobiia bacterium]|nr:formate dehydrogenase subunit delta [Acidimicrobiia bacterium]